MPSASDPPKSYKKRKARLTAGFPLSGAGEALPAGGGSAGRVPGLTRGGGMLPDEMEVLRPDLPRGRFRSVLFDFDGTLSLIREGWPQVMIPMMVGVLGRTGTAETEAELTAAVEEFV